MRFSVEKLQELMNQGVIVVDPRLERRIRENILTPQDIQFLGYNLMQRSAIEIILMVDAALPDMQAQGLHFNELAQKGNTLVDISAMQELLGSYIHSLDLIREKSKLWMDLWVKENTQNRKSEET